MPLRLILTGFVWETRVTFEVFRREFKFVETIEQVTLKDGICTKNITLNIKKTALYFTLFIPNTTLKFFYFIEIIMFKINCLSCTILDTLLQNNIISITALHIGIEQRQISFLEFENWFFFSKSVTVCPAFPYY